MTIEIVFYSMTAWLLLNLLSSRLGNNHPFFWVDISGFCRPSRLSHPCASAGYSHFSLEAILCIAFGLGHGDHQSRAPLPRVVSLLVSVGLILSLTSVLKNLQIHMHSTLATLLSRSSNLISLISGEACIHCLYRCYIKAVYYRNGG